MLLEESIVHCRKTSSGSPMFSVKELDFCRFLQRLPHAVWSLQALAYAYHNHDTYEHIVSTFLANDT